MGLFVKRGTPSAAKESPAARRARSIPTHELTDWAEQCLFTVHQNLDRYRRDLDLDYLAEAQDGADVLLVVLAEMQRRFSV